MSNDILCVIFHTALYFFNVIKVLQYAFGTYHEKVSDSCFKPQSLLIFSPSLNEPSINSSKNRQLLLHETIFVAEEVLFWKKCFSEHLNGIFDNKNRLV